MGERKVCGDCGCVFTTAGYENPDATTHEHWQGCVAALQAELAAERERAARLRAALDEIAVVTVSTHPDDIFYPVVEIIGRVLGADQQQEAGND